MANRVPATAAAKMSVDTRLCSRKTLAVGSATTLPVSGRASRALAADEGAIGAWLAPCRPLRSSPVLRSPRDGVRRAEGSAGRRRRTRPRPRRRLRRSSAADPRAPCRDASPARRCRPPARRSSRIGKRPSGFRQVAGRCSCPLNSRTVPAWRRRDAWAFVCRRHPVCRRCPVPGRASARSGTLGPGERVRRHQPPPG